MTEQVPSSTSQEAVASLGSSSDQLLRPARALIGWLPEDRGLLMLNSNRADAAATAEQRTQVASARLAVQQRPVGLDQTDAVQELPEGLLNEHVARLRAGPAEPYFAEGWRVALVDLRRICAFQPSVFTDSAADRAAGIDLGDLGQVALVTLPTEWHLDQQAQLDEARHLWLFASRNPNLRVMIPFAGPVGPQNLPGFGFVVTVMPSFLQVAAYQSRLFLRDGYHRAIGLLTVGVGMVPAFVREFTSIQELVPPGMLPQEAFMGDRPPVLADYADGMVAATVQLPASQKMVVIQGLELSPHA